MTETERWVYGVCDGLVKSGHVRLYRDLYKDLRQSLPCRQACLMIAAGLRLSRTTYLPGGGLTIWRVIGDRARALASLARLARWASTYQRASRPGCGVIFSPEE